MARWGTLRKDLQRSPTFQQELTDIDVPSLSSVQPDQAVVMSDLMGFNLESVEQTVFQLLVALGRHAVPRRLRTE
jgi:hypothetical protein